MTLVFCTHNAHKTAEAKAILGSGFNFLTLSDIGFQDEIPEPFETLEENALTKAHTVFNRFGYDAFAEDTGLFVAALNGAPGVRSARFAGEHGDSAANIRLLLSRLEGEENRAAHFKTVIALVRGGAVDYFTGICHGQIASVASGISGFGYDPVFIPEGDTRTFAEYRADEKNAISHRRKALDAFATFLHHLQP